MLINFKFQTLLEYFLEFSPYFITFVQSLLFPGKEKVSDEPSALEALHNLQDLAPKGFHLVPEHVETRSLFNPEKPGIDMVNIVLVVLVIQLALIFWILYTLDKVTSV